jgi:RNA polymerase sigma-70 factor (ECF subfamily)
MALVVREITSCQSALYAYVCALLGGSGGAADVLQEANLVLWEKASEYDSSRPFLPWAYQIAHFQVLAYRKKCAREKLLFDDEMLNAVSDSIRRRDVRMDQELQALDHCLAKLPENNRRVVDARYVNAEPVESIAKRLRRAPNAVAAELYRARKLLADCIRRAMARGETA